MKQFGVEDVGSDEEGGVPADVQKAKDMVFEKNNLGHFILPPIEN